VPLAVLQPGAPSGQSLVAERRVVAAAAGALDLRWLGLTLLWPLVDLRSPLAPWPAALALAAGYGLSGSAAALPMARLSDRLGRRVVLLATTAIFAVGSALLVVSGAVSTSLGRVLMGIGAGAAPALGWVSDAVAVDRRPRAHTLFSLSASLAPPVGILLGTVLGFGPRWGAPALLAGVALLALAALLRTPEVPPRCAGAALRSDSLYALVAILRSPALSRPLAAAACGAAAAALGAGLLPGAIAALPGALAAVAILLGAAGAAAGFAASTALANRGRAGLALALALTAMWLAGTLLSGRDVDHAGAPLRALPALALLAAGSGAVAAAALAQLLERSPEMWRGTVLAGYQLAALLGAGLGGALGVATARIVGVALAPVPLAVLAIVGARAALKLAPPSPTRVHDPHLDHDPDPSPRGARNS
jgi:predicted MFS family arabinose efflux permease